MSKRSFSETQQEDDIEQNVPKRTLQSDGKGNLVKASSFRVQIRDAFKLLNESFHPNKPVDFCCPLEDDTKIYKDYDCALVKDEKDPVYFYNRKKVYILQLLVKSSPYDQYFLWRRWNSAVGVDGLLKGPFFELKDAIDVFELKFFCKTENLWSGRKNFKQKPGKCHLLTESDWQGQRDILQLFQYLSFAASVLDSDMQQLIELITGDFSFELQKMNLDLKKMPTTQLNPKQIAEGYRILDAVENAIRSKVPVSQLDHLTKYFYRVIPHTAKRIQTTFKDLYTVQEKKELLKVLEDVELMTRLQRKRFQEIPWSYLLRNDNFGVSDQKRSVFPSVTDLQYELLNCKLTHVDGVRENYEVIHNYVKNTGRLGVMHIWKVQRENEETSYAEHDSLKNRKLLWYGTHTASVATILRSGLRINYHLNGRLGNGLYFASQNAKAANSVSYNVKGQGIMFLCEVALGTEYHALEDDDTLLAPPDGFQSVVGKGIREPDPANDVTIILDGREVVVPQGPPRIMEDYRHSGFSQSEYVVYQESQIRIRYLVQVTYRHQRLE